MMGVRDRSVAAALPLRAALLVLAGAVGLFWVYAVNGTVLFYIDTAHYIDVGERLIDRVLAGDPSGDADGGGDAAAESDDEGSVNVSRSLVYALAAGIVARIDSALVFVLAQAALTLGMVWIVARILSRELPGRGTDMPALVWLPLAACAGSSLPFFIAFFMPDLLAPLGILAAALIAVFAARLHWWELLLLWLVAVASVTVHLSHLATMVVLLPLVVIVAQLLPGRWWLPSALLGSVVAAGFAPLLAVHLALSQSRDAAPSEADPAAASAPETVTFTPFITARLIVDGPGYAFLETACPDAAIATCDLYEALGWSDDPYRMTASHIIFETSPRLGSYRLLPLDSRAAIAAEQSRFFLMVLRDQPLGVIGAMLKNTLQQARMFSIDMTLPTEQAADIAQATLEDARPDWLARGALAQRPAITRLTDPLHAAVYALSLAGTLALLLLPGSALPMRVRVFAVMVLLGVLANAFICGGVSQPATRYGARTIWLLPYLAVVLAVLAAAARSQTRGRRP